MDETKSKFEIINLKGYYYIFLLSFLLVSTSAVALPSVTGTVYDLVQEYSPEYDCMRKHGIWQITVSPGSLVTFTRNYYLQPGTISFSDGTTTYPMGTKVFATGNTIYIYYEILEWDPYYYSLTSDTPLFDFYYTTESGYTNQDKLYLKSGKIETPTNLTLSNPNGYVQIGAQSTGNATVNTDKTRFLFNEPVWVQDGAFSSNSTSNLLLQTNGTTRMTILNSNGNVGIGTTSPSSKLSVIGAIYASDGYKVNDTRTVNDQPQQKPSGAISYDFKYRNSVNTPDLDISASNDYAHIMTVAGWSTNEGSGGWPMQLSFGANGIGIRQAINATTWGAWRKTIVADQNGNVGIGTGTAQAARKLSVNSSDYGIASFCGGKVSGSYQYSQIYIGQQEAAGYSANFGYMAHQTDQSLSGMYLTNYGDAEGTSGLFIRKGGNVGIGLTLPAYKLDVNGTIHAKEVIIDTDFPSVPDFVFSSTYKLMPLTEVEKFVKENNHLPEIPSAKETSEKGINMGTMQNKLLQKIEELTLYVIEQQKRIDELEKRHE